MGSAERDGPLRGIVSSSLSQQNEWSSAASYPLDILLSQALEPVKAVLGNLKGEEVSYCIVIVWIGQNQLALPFGVQQVRVVVGYF